MGCTFYGSDILSQAPAASSTCESLPATTRTRQGAQGTRGALEGPSQGAATARLAARTGARQKVLIDV